MEGVSKRVDQAEARLDAHDTRLDAVEAFERVHDARIGELETRVEKQEHEGRALVMAAQAVQTLASQVKSALDSIEEIAERAAQKAVERDREQRTKTRTRRISFWAAVTGGFGAGVYTVLEIVLSLAHHR